MHPINSVALIYLFFTLISSGIIYGVFRKNADASAKYFFLAEIFMSVTAAVIFIENYAPDFYPIKLTAAANFFVISSEIAVLFSIKSLVREIPFRRFFIILIGAIIYVCLIEIVRPLIGLKVIVVIHNTLIMCISILIYLASRFKGAPALANNQFITSFKAFEFCLLVFSILRILSAFSNSPIIPRESPNSIVVALFSLYVTLSVCRYMSYIGLRITWVDIRTYAQNPLNRDLAKATEEKDQFLRGLIASNRVIGVSALASSLAHQLSQPLTAIALQADRSRRELARSEQNPVLTSSLDEISKQSSKLAELVNNLRQLFSFRDYEFHPFSLQKVCSDILEIVAPTLQTKKIKLIQNLQSDPLVHGDALQIQQVLINVLNNAIDVISQAAPALKEIKLTITQNSEFAILAIEDSGVGIEEATLPSIFDLYRTTKDSGLGVGLWLSKTIMERHHGSITASNSPNGGAIFEIQLPLAKSATRQTEITL